MIEQKIKQIQEEIEEVRKQVPNTSSVGLQLDIALCAMEKAIAESYQLGAWDEII